MNAFYYWKQQQQQNDKNNAEAPLVLCGSFNQINSHLIVGTQRGYNIYALKPFAPKTSYVFHAGATNGLEQSQEISSEIKPVAAAEPQANGDNTKCLGIGCTEMLFRTNILALVGGGNDPAFDPTVVLLWDDAMKQTIGKIACQKPVRNVKLTKNLIVIVTDNTVSIFDHDLKPMHAPIETNFNPKGICALSPDADNTVLAFPSITKGHVRVERLNEDKKIYIKAHDGDITCLALSKDGNLLATASEKGTLIRIFDTESRQQIKEVRRGSTHAEIYCIAFSNDKNYLCCVSSSGTVHMFSVNPDASQNRKSSFQYLSYVMDINVLKSEWSFAECRLAELKPNTPAICSFGNESNTIRIFSANGYFHEVVFDLEKGGEPIKITSVNMIESLSM